MCTYMMTEYGIIPGVTCNTGARAVAAQVLAGITWADDLDGACHAGILTRNGQIKHRESHCEGRAHCSREVKSTLADPLFSELVACSQVSVLVPCIQKTRLVDALMYHVGVH